MRSLPFFERVDFRQLGRRRREHGEAAVGARRRDSMTTWRPLDEPLDRAARGRHPRDVLRAIVDDDERERRAVRRPDRRRDRTVERRRSGCAARRRRRGSPPAWSGRRRSTSARRRAGRRSDFPSGLHASRPLSSAVVVVSRRGCAPGLRVDDEHVAVRHLVDVAFAMACGRTRSACRRATTPAMSSSNAPGVSGLGLLRGDVEQIEVRSLAAQVAVDVRLEVVAIDDDRLRRLRLVVLCVSSVVASVATDRDRSTTSDEPLAVGRPGVVGDAALDVGELDRFAAGAVQQPDLAVLRPLPGRDERQVLAVRAPARRRLAVGRRRQLDLLACRPSSPSRRRCRSCRCP